ncbi:MAG: polysaccharide deacetylase family protein [bacterium]|jgi:hypothetical protein
MHRHQITIIIFVLLATLLLTLPAVAASLAPAAPVTRLQLAQILAQGLDLPAAENEPNFIDIPPDGLAHDAIARVHQAGLMSGFPGGLFRPQVQVTRAQAVSVLLVAAGTYPSSPAAQASLLPERAFVSAPFSDVPAHHWACASVTRAWQKGLAAGSTDGRFFPNKPITSWELAQFVQRFLGEDVAARAGLKQLVHMDPPVAPEHSASAVPVLLYHHLAPSGSGFDTNNATITPEEFTWQMQYLADQRYKVLTPAELTAFLSGELRVPKRSVAITFDDGYASNLKYAYPILKQHGFSAIFHVITGTVPDQPQQPYDPTRLQSLSWPELKDLSASGLITMASHTNNMHMYLSSGVFGLQRPAIVAYITDPATGRTETEAGHYHRILTDLKTSRSKLEQELGQPVTILAYPYGVSDPAAHRAATEAGFTLTFSTRPTLARFSSGLNDVPRLVVRPGISQGQFERLLQGY